jgi:DNA processing protein
MLDEKVVAIVGTRRASDYGMEIASELARGLAASGITVASDLAEGIPSAALAGALEADGRPLAVMSGGVVQCTPAWCNSLYRSVLERGCSIGESRMRRRTRVWWRYASARTLALLSELVIVVEATEQPWDTACANLGWSRARHVAAVPGRVNASASRGTNALLMKGARLVRNAQDALNVLYDVGICDVETVDRPFAGADLDPQLAGVLELVGDGQDTLAKLARCTHSGDVAVALAELELCGLLSRGDGGRYLPCAPILTGE